LVAIFSRRFFWKPGWLLFFRGDFFGNQVGCAFCRGIFFGNQGAIVKTCPGQRETATSLEEIPNYKYYIKNTKVKGWPGFVPIRFVPKGDWYKPDWHNFSLFDFQHFYKI